MARWVVVGWRKYRPAYGGKTAFLIHVISRFARGVLFRHFDENAILNLGIFRDLFLHEEAKHLLFADIIVIEICLYDLPAEKGHMVEHVDMGIELQWLATVIDESSFAFCSEVDYYPILPSTEEAGIDGGYLAICWAWCLCMEAEG